MKPYKPEVTKEQIILDGWAHGFQPPQTKDELAQMGFEVTLEYIAEEFCNMDNEMMDTLRYENECRTRL